MFNPKDGTSQPFLILNFRNYMNNFSSKFAFAVVNNRIGILLASLLLVVVSIGVIVAKPLGYNNSNEMWFLPGDPNLVAFEKLQEMFGDS